MERLKAQRLTLEQLSKAIGGRRFVAGKWVIEINGKEIDLTKIAKLTLRELEAPAFTVMLRDGREVLITPVPEKVGHYVVTGQYFEENVRHALADFSGQDPAKVYVLEMIPVPGTVVPHLTEEGSMRHFSLGEPLDRFANVELRANPPTRELKNQLR